MPHSTSDTASASSLQSASAVTPERASALLAAGKAWIADVRETDEYRQQHIAGSVLCPTSLMGAEDFPPARPGQEMLVLCRSGTRAGHVAQALHALGRADVHVIQGGISAWAKDGLPVVTNVRAPLPIIRQVMVTVGTLVLAFVALGAFVHPLWLVGAGAMGAGLLFAGATGICAMASLLGRAPWNRSPLVKQCHQCHKN